MALRIATNVESLSSQRSLGINREAMNRSLEKLATGERIVRAADDAAGLSISEKMKAEIRSTAQASRNANDAISLVQTAEGGYNEIQNILIRVRELSMQSASDTVGNGERGFTDKEVQGLLSEVDRIAKSTVFNNTHLLDGSTGVLEFQVGTHNNPELDRLNYDSSHMNVTRERLGMVDMHVRDKENAQGNLDRLDKVIETVNSQRAELGAFQNRLTSTIANLAVARENMEASNSRIRDTDVASESSELTKRNILMQAGTAMLAQANAAPNIALKLLG
ncbi:MAG: flagellin FliC [Deltaproteobacteria bacterium]|nr:flagellin FliC [Deltaproteobacteria bacterium]